MLSQQRGAVEIVEVDALDNCGFVGKILYPQLHFGAS